MNSQRHPTMLALTVATMAVTALLTACGLVEPSPPTDLPAAHQTSGPAVSTRGVLCELAGSAFNADASVQLTATYRWSCDDSMRRLIGNGLPDHPVGRFPGPGNPNPIGAVETRAAYPLQPAPAGRITGIQTAGYALNGVKLEPATAGTCDDSGRNCRMARSSMPWQLEALGQSAFQFGTDASNGHVQPSGAYHYHGIPEQLLARLSQGRPVMTLVAWAADGYPIYARYGQRATDPAGATAVVMRSSYQLKTTPDPGRPPVSAYAMGTFTQDYRYVAGSGDLDECNGRTGVTPEFPSGTYHYLITDTFPFIGRCVKGTATSRR